MTKETTRDVRAVNIRARYVVDDNGLVGDIRGFLDEYGDDTDDLAEARFAIIQWRDDLRWSPLDLSDYSSPLLYH